MANNSSAEKQRAHELVCVTGAGGFIGPWVVKELLLHGYRVRGTARDPEMAATEEATRRGLQLAVVVPPMTIGPMFQQYLNVSNYHVARYLMGTKKAYPNAVAIYADVRDVVHAHLLVYERHHAGGRYLCFGMALHRSCLLRLLRDLFPHYPITSKCEEKDKPMASPYRFSNQRLEDLGLEFTDMRRTLYETVICLQQKGHVRIIVPYQRSSL